VTETDLHSLTGVYAAHALDGDELASFEQHLGECSACRSEVAELTETTSWLAAAVATSPPSELRARVLAEVAHVRQLPPLTPVSELDELEQRRARRWYRQPLAAAAALMLVVSVGLGAFAVDARQRAQLADERATRIAAIATDPDRVEVDVPVTSGGHGTVIAADGSAIFRTSDIAQLPDDRVYQLWIIRGDSPQSAGVLGRGGELEAFVEGIRPTDALGLTIEPSGGSTMPTGELVLRAEMA
jgi:anti-sigma factor RsiW